MTPLNLRAFAKMTEKHGPDDKVAERYRLAAKEIELRDKFIKEGGLWVTFHDWLNVRGYE